MRKPTTRDLSDRHEVFLAALFGGRRSAGSGNQFNDQMDGRNDRHTAHSLAWDGKATQGKSVGVTLEMWRKAIAQAHGQTAMLALRFYGTSNKLDVLEDLVVLDVHDFAEMLQDARAYRALGNDR